jgi:hypothetical protein
VRATSAAQPASTHYINTGLNFNTEIVANKRNTATCLRHTASFSLMAVNHIERYVPDRASVNMPPRTLSYATQRGKFVNVVYVAGAIGLTPIFCIVWGWLEVLAWICNCFDNISTKIPWVGGRRTKEWSSVVPSYNPGTDKKRRRLSFDGNIQAQSHLWKLPLEVRQQIYAECIAGYKIHISFNWIVAGSKRKMPMNRRVIGHTRCKDVTANECSLCIILTRRMSEIDECGVDGMLNLLRVCRRM